MKYKSVVSSKSNYLPNNSIFSLVIFVLLLSIIPQIVYAADGDTIMPFRWRTSPNGITMYGALRFVDTFYEGVCPQHHEDPDGYPYPHSHLPHGFPFDGPGYEITAQMSDWAWDAADEYRNQERITGSTFALNCYAYAVNAPTVMFYDGWIAFTTPTQYPEGEGLSYKQHGVEHVVKVEDFSGPAMMMSMNLYEFNPGEREGLAETSEKIASSGVYHTYFGDLPPYAEYRRRKQADRAEIPDQQVSNLTYPANFVLNYPNFVRRVSQQVQMLQLETLEQSLKNLDDDDPYARPGPGLSNGYGLTKEIFPLDGKHGQKDVDAIMSSRRFLKVLHELSNLPKEKASGLIIREIENSIGLYRQLYHNLYEENRLNYTVEKIAEKMRLGEPVMTAPMVLNNGPGGEVVLIGARYKILSLMLLAGQMQLEATRPTLEKIVREAMEQRDFLYQDKNYDEFFKYGLLKFASLYNRQILLTALAGAAPKSKNLTVEFKSLGLESRQKHLTRYNALFTPYDILIPGVGSRPDYRLGEQIVTYSPTLDDDTFNTILEKFYSIKND